MNPVLTQIPRAQEAYISTVENWKDVDTTDLLLACDREIKAAVGRGHLITAIGGIQDVRFAEKAALELQELGYSTTTIASGQAVQPDGTVRQLSGIQICWKFLPANTRDEFTV